MIKLRACFILCLFAIAVNLTGCAPKTVTKVEAFPDMYTNMPLSILVLPPINETTSAEAKDYYTVTVSAPLAFAGFYVIPQEVSNEIFKSQGVYDTELMLNTPGETYKKYFGADAVLFVKITEWDTSYYVIGGSVTVGLEMFLKSTDTDQIIWKYNGRVVQDTTTRSGGGGLAGLVLDLALTAANTAMTDYVPVARKVNYRIVHSLPVGKHNPMHMKDQQFSGIVMEATR